MTPCVRLGPPRFRDSEILATGVVAVCILYGQVAMLIYRDAWDPNFVPATLSILAGFLLFQFDQWTGVWTDAIWHIILAVWIHFCMLSAISMDSQLYNQCLG